MAALEGKPADTPPRRRPYPAGRHHARFTRHCTASLPEDCRLDYWQQLFSMSCSPNRHAPAGTGFHGNMLASPVVEGGMAFVHLHADPLACRFGKGDNGLLMLGHVNAGAIGMRYSPHEEVLVTPASGLVLVDCDKPLTSLSTQHDMSYLLLPRALAEATMHGNPISAGRSFRRLPGSTLASLVTAHMDTLARQGECLDANGALAAMQAARTLVLALLASVQAPATRPLEESALYTAACHLIRQSFDNPGFNAEALAATLGCSRAHLYRVFSRHERSVAAYLRDIRLEQARKLLETRPEKPVGTIALDCGYTDLSAFGKAFRRRFGHAPSEWRARAAAQ